ncbi:MAG: hypothetical protein IJ934_02575 [Acetobacter sp.]|nr:hypothetical protein [Acetobacter sp.]
MTFSLSACGKKQPKLPDPTEETCSKKYLAAHPELQKLLVKIILKKL